MTDHTTHARDAMFGRETCLLGDPCFFRLSPMHHEQSGRVVGRVFGGHRFDIEADDGTIHRDITDVRLDHDATMLAGIEAEKIATAESLRTMQPLMRDLGMIEAGLIGGPDPEGESPYGRGNGPVGGRQ